MSDCCNRNDPSENHAPGCVNLVPPTRPTGEWVICAEIHCDNLAVLDLLHRPTDGTALYVPLCDIHLEQAPTGLEYRLDTHGFMRGLA